MTDENIPILTIEKFYEYIYSETFLIRTNQEKKLFG